jgi:hypothetical protein
MSKSVASANRAAVAIIAALCAIFAALVYATGTASAEIDGPCSATINGVDVGSVDTGNRDDDITVQENTSVPVTMAAAVGIASHRIEMEYGGFRSGCTR